MEALNIYNSPTFIRTCLFLSSRCVRHAIDVDEFRVVLRLTDHERQDNVRLSEMPPREEGTWSAITLNHNGHCTSE